MIPGPGFIARPFLFAEKTLRHVLLGLPLPDRCLCPHDFSLQVRNIVLQFGDPERVEHPKFDAPGTW